LFEFFHKIAWLIPVFPLVGFAVCIFFPTYLKDRGCHLVATYLMLASSVVSTGVLLTHYFLNPTGEPYRIAVPWLTMSGYRMDFSFTIDNVTSAMVFMVSNVAMLIHLFSQGYMAGEKRYSRFFAHISLFTFSMLGVVMTDNLLALYMFWEIMGLCSYLLIAFYFEKASACYAGIKAFLVTRIGDVGFLFGILMAFIVAGSFNLSDIKLAFEDPGNVAKFGGVFVTVAGIALFMGAVGKSAQFPLHVWLPDAMEGPTPVSALIHAATMVAAGVYMTARVFAVISASVTTMAVVATIGAMTLLISSLLGLVMNDIKKVLAYSTISQLGYMVLALGVGGFTASLFHLLNHAYFKACLFLGSGSVILGCHHEQDMRKMGGLRKYMPITFVTFWLATLALMGVFPFSGFFSKDEILSDTFARAGEMGGAYWLLFVAGEVGAFLTAFYMTRLMALTFYGAYRGGHAEEGHGAHAPKESPWVVTLPLVVLSFLSLTAGWVGIPALAPFFQKYIQFHAEAHPPAPNWTVMAVSTVMALGGILTAYVVYGQGAKAFQALYRTAPVRAVEKVLVNKYYFDFFYDTYIVGGVVALARILSEFDLTVIDGVVNGFAVVTTLLYILSDLVDRYIVDGLVNLAGYMWVKINHGIRYAQSGYVQHYIFVTALAMVALIIVVIKPVLHLLAGGTVPK
jgi:NADH-quinone oxidoreductase subunit L